MDANAHTVFHGRRAYRLHLLGTQRVDSVRAENGRDAAVPAFPALDEADAFLNRVRRVLRIRTALVDHGRGYQCAHAAGFDDFGDGVRVVIHVDECRRSTANHFPAGKFGPDADEFRVDELHFRGKNVLGEPVE